MICDREMNSPGTHVSENVSIKTEMNRFRFMYKERDHAHTDEADSPMVSTAVDRPVLVHRCRILLLRAVQVLSSRSPWVAIVLCKVCGLGLSRLVLGRHRGLRAGCRGPADLAAQAVPGGRDTGCHHDGGGDHTHSRSRYAC